MTQLDKDDKARLTGYVVEARAIIPFPPNLRGGATLAEAAAFDLADTFKSARGAAVVSVDIKCKAVTVDRAAAEKAMVALTTPSTASTGGDG